MREIFLESYYIDVQKVYDNKLKNDEEYSKRKEEALKIYNELWNMLSQEQQDKYREFEIAQGTEKLIEDENLYIYALKKGVAIGFEIAKSF